MKFRYLLNFLKIKLKVFSYNQFSYINIPKFQDMYINLYIRKNKSWNMI